ncbi:MAG: acyl-CoA/acyl-ACP dehydrogenase, partial [Nitrososphaerota archaeon]|nr:acyl-CoA/acyl-ACP dehydrogenase [Nitrososphaerota archaeon]
DGPVGDEILRPGQPEPVPVPGIAGLQGARVRAGLRLGQAVGEQDEYEKSPGTLSVRTDGDRLSAVAKYVSSRCAFESADRAVQCFGGFGYSIMSPVAKHFLDSRVARIYEGTDEIMELKIASSVLGRGFEAYR